MNKAYKIILISTIAIFSAGFLFVLPTNATPVAPLIVEYSVDGGATWLPLSGPIFNETNFLPGNNVTRQVRVTNNSENTQRIATEAINENDPNGLASRLDLTIKEGPTPIFSDTLKKFFDQGETYLSSLSNGTQTQYNFTIAFGSGAGDNYQGKILGFDILVGFESTEGGLTLPQPGGGTNESGGVVLPSGLTIANETNQTVTADSVTIIWTTNYLASSQVIYGTALENHLLDLTDDIGAPPKYGYAHTTPEYDISPKVLAHSVTITGLTPNTTYYYRAVSHASFAVSTEHSFTTLTGAPGGIMGSIAQLPGDGGSVVASGGAGDSGPEEINNQVAGAFTENEGVAITGGSGGSGVSGGCIGAGCSVAEGGTEKTIGGIGNLLADMGQSSGISNFWWLILILFALIFIFWCFLKKDRGLTRKV